MLPEARIVGPLMEDLPIYGSAVLRPLVFHVDKRPLPAAKAKVLNAGELEVVGFLIHQCILVQVTPSGAGSTCTV